jgi:hypothetical protein
MEENQNQTNQEPAKVENMDVNRTVSTDDLGLLKNVEVEKTAEETNKPEWLPEKFKSPEDLAKSYTELEKKLADVPKTPEKYDWNFTEKLDLQVNPDENTMREAEDSFTHLGLSQKQVEGVINLYKDQLDIIDQTYAKNNPQIDLEQQNAELKHKWGTEYESKLEAVKKFATKFAPQTLTQPLASTAEGLQIMYDMMSSGRVPNPITDSGRTNVSEMDIREKIAELRKDPKMNLNQGDLQGEKHRAELYAQYEKLSRLGR